MAGAVALSTPASSYFDVHVLLLSWQDGDEDIYKQLVDLKVVFEEDYNYNVEEWAIPSENSYHALDDKLSQFLQKDGKEILLILYYGGHGTSNSDKAAVWMRFDNPDSPRIIWSSLQPKFFQRKADILMILDCCSAGSAICEKGEGMIEGLLASGAGVKTPVSGKYAFTINLVSQLRNYCTKGVTVSHLHHDLTQNVKYSQPNSSRQQVVSPHYIRQAELPGEFRTIELMRAASFVTAPSTMTAPSIYLQPHDSGSLAKASRDVGRGPEAPATEAVTTSGSILEVINQVQDYEEFDLPGNTGNKFTHYKDLETRTASDCNSIRHSVLWSYQNSSEDEVPTNPQSVDVVTIVTGSSLANQQDNRVQQVINDNKGSLKQFQAVFDIKADQNYGHLLATIKNEDSAILNSTTTNRPTEGFKYFRRIVREIRDMSRTSPGSSVAPFSTDWTKFLASIEGPPGTPYAGGIFWLFYVYPPNYPFSRPRVHFITRIYHPNIDSRGKICLNIIGESWAVSLSMDSVLTSIISLLSDPGLDDPLVPEIAQIFIENNDLYCENASLYTKKYATGQRPEIATLLSLAAEAERIGFDS